MSLTVAAVRAASHLGELVRFPTVSSSDSGAADSAQFEAFIDALSRLYPRVHAQLESERINTYGLLFRWKGSSANSSQRPTVLMAHYDVVPVDEDDDWTHPPFSGHNDGVYVWGRGTLDDKGALVVILEAVELLLEAGFQPGQDIYLSFGNNEEIAGDTAGAVVDLLQHRNIKPWLVLDEGGAVTEGAFPGVRKPAAVVGVAEKGMLDVRLLTRSPGGHASTPPRMGATARLARAIVRLEKHPFPAALPDPTVQMVETFGRHAPLPLRLAFTNLRLLKWPVTRLFGLLGGETNAMTRTTVAVTRLEGSKGANVLAATSKAQLNIRIAVGSSVEATVERLHRIIRDPRVEITVLEGSDPTPVSATDNEQFALLRNSIDRVFPEAFVVPYILMACTDARRFNRIATAVYRFAPFEMSTEARASLHGVNERILISTLGRGVSFYQELIRMLP